MFGVLKSLYISFRKTNLRRRIGGLGMEPEVGDILSQRRVRFRDRSLASRVHKALTRPPIYVVDQKDQVVLTCDLKAGRLTTRWVYT